MPWAQAITWTAVGIGSGHTGNLERASQAEKSLAALRNASATQNNSYWSNQIEVQRREVVAGIAEKSGKGADAITTLRSAAELEESMDKHAVTPGAVTPAREMVAQLLSLENHPQEALAEYEAVLKLAPNRFNALYGADCAVEASGNASMAQRYFQKVTEVTVDEARPELVRARKKAANARSTLQTKP